MRHTPERLGPETRGGDPQLHAWIVRPAALLRHRLAASERPRQVEVQVGNRDRQRSRNREKALGGDILEPPLHLGEVGGRQLRGLRQRGQRPLGFHPPAAQQGAERDSN
jgi:hypothetical protein